MELEEEVAHLTNENLEYRLKLKELAEHNRMLQMRVLELNELYKGSEEIEKLREANADLRRQLSVHLLH